jgi:hypothetical protein
MLLTDQNKPILEALKKIGLCQGKTLMAELGITLLRRPLINALCDEGMITAVKDEKTQKLMYNITKAALSLLEASQLPFGIASPRSAMPTEVWKPPQMGTTRPGASDSKTLRSLGNWGRA